ncbi:MAG: L-fucose/L-arabinose isomerase family protein [Caldicoprobacterales bacterium]
MKKNVTIGVVCLARETYDFNAARELYQSQKANLGNIENVEWVFIDDLVISIEDAEAAARKLASKLLDGLVIISGTFHLGHLALILDKHVQRPILLWAFKELPYNGGKIRLNSVCGLNLNASNLYKAGIDHFSCIVSDSIDEDWIDALRIKNIISNAHLGLVGYRADGFFNLSVNDLSFFQKTGILIDHYELSELFQNANEKLYDASSIFDCSGITEAQIDKVENLTTSMEKFIKDNKLDALAVRCWPEFANTYGISPCAAMSILGAKDHIIACEGDVEGAISLLACRAISSQPPFFADLSQVDFEENVALMWHCGVAPECLWDGKSDKTLDTYFAAGRGVTADFVLKPGQVTIFRIDSARGKTRFFLQKGVAIPTEKELKGTYTKVKLEKNINEVLDIITTNGIAHHVVLLYGDYSNILRRFARIMNLEVIE